MMISLNEFSKHAVDECHDICLALVSGGCNDLGYVPIGKASNIIRLLKELGWRVAAHVCVVDESYAKMLHELGVDVALLDLEIDPVVIRYVRNLRRYAETLFIEGIATLKKFGLKVYPHIVVGEFCGMPRFEIEAVELLTTVDIDGLALVVFTPLPSTPYEYCPHPDPYYVKNVMRIARSLIGKPIALGCMRPRLSELEFYAYEIGFDGIANPSLQIVEELREPYEVFNTCCCYLALQ